MDARGRQEWTAEDVADRLKDLFAEEPPSGDVSLLIDAAAVLATFDLEQVSPIGGPLPNMRLARAELARMSTVTRNERGAVCWMLERDARRRTIGRLVTGRRVDEALAANPERPMGRMQRALEDLLHNPSEPGSAREVADLRARLIVLDWLQGVIPGLPTPSALRDQIDRATLLEPFRELVGSYFAGRQRELAMLADYADILSASGVLEGAIRLARSVMSIVKEPPLFVYGPGGIGKSTLIAKFILDHLDNPAVLQFPFAYLDLDRPGLVAEEPITLLIETLRQLAIQYPQSRAQIEALQREWAHRIVETTPARRPAELERRPDAAAEAAPVASTVGVVLPTNHALWSNLRLKDRDYYLETFAATVRSLQHGPQPMLLVLDTFEQVQLRSPALVGEIFSFLEQIQTRLPFVRTVLSGRVVAAPSGFTVKELALSIFDLDAATAYLTQRARVDAVTAEAVARQVTGSPLTLKLAADLLNRERASSSGFDTVSGGFLGALLNGSVEAQLYSRVLGHIADPDVRKLAHPGLVLRRITPDIIRDVLAEPCGIVVPDRQTAEALFNRLRAEVVLVTELRPDVVVHRADLRVVMLNTLRHDEPDRVAAIHRRAVAYYEAHGDDAESRAEEMYHRLSLDFDRATLEPRWQEGLGTYLTASVPELAPRAQAFVAARSGLALAPEIWAHADIEDWERYAIGEVRESLRVGRIDEALTLLAGRTGWSSPELRALHVQAVAHSGRLDDARALARDLLPSVGNNPDLAESLRGYADAPEVTPTLESVPTVSTRDIRSVAEAVQDAFSDLEMVTEVLERFGLPDLRSLVPSAPSPLRHQRELGTAALAMVSIAASEGWLDTLLLALRRARPENLRLWRAAQQLGLTANGYPTSDEEGFAEALALSMRPGDLRRRLTQIEGQTCCVQVGRSVCTGFLVGPDLVLTVDSPEIPSDDPTLNLGPHSVRVTFDRWTTDTSVTMKGIECGLASDRIAAAGDRGDKTARLPYAILRLDQRVGELPGADHGQRGWMTLPSDVRPEPKTSVAAMRFDSRRGLVFSYSRTGMRKIDAGERSLEYELETDAVAPGAPILDKDFTPVAMHVGLESWLQRLTATRLTRGIPLDAIARDLRAQNIVLPARSSG